jgi:hypothetical protein
MWTGSEWIPTPPKTAENNNQTSGKEKVEIEQPSIPLQLFIGSLIIFGLLVVFVSITSSSNQENNETYIQWTNVDDCLFQVELVASEGLVHREIVDYSDRVSWEGLDQYASKPYTFTISNLQSSGADCFTTQRLFSNGDLLIKDVSLGPGEDSVLTIY